MRGRGDKDRPRPVVRLFKQPCNDESSLGDERVVDTQQLGVPHPAVEREARVVEISYGNRGQGIA